MTRLRKILSEHGPWLALFALLLICCLSSEAFRRPQNLINILRQNAPTGIIAIGMTWVILAGGIDLSVGSLLALSGGLGILAMRACPTETGGLFVGIGVALAIGLLGGCLNGALVTLGGIPPFIATLGTMSIFRSLILHAGKAGVVTSENSLYNALDSHRFLQLYPAIWILLLLTALGAFFLKRTRTGRYFCAVGDNERVARYAAIPVGWTKFKSYALCGLLCGIAAVLQGGKLSSVSSSNAGLGCELDAIAMVIIGGTSMAGGRGTIWGTLSGVCMLGIISNVLVMWSIAPNLQGLMKGLVILAAVLIQRGKRS